MLDFLILGNPGNRRITLFQEALRQLELPLARVVSYLDLMAGRDSLHCSPHTVMRIESPGKDFEVERALLQIGAVCDDSESEYERLSVAALQSLVFEKGCILPSRQWYLGYCALLNRLTPQLAGVPLMNTPSDIQIMFDKRACHQHLQCHDIAVPQCLPPIENYQMLIGQMRQMGWHSVFVKLAHGSSASGVVAYRVNGQRHQAITTVEMAESGEAIRLYNSRQMQTYTDPRVIARLIDTLCRNRVHVEQWIPKAGINGKTFDLRVMTIAGRVQHSVVRMSHSPITNLHLLNERGDLDSILPQIGASTWAGARQTCERAAQSFDSLYSGIDLAFAPNYRHHAILEMNAFGDLLPGILYQGRDTYTSQILAIQERVIG